MQPVACVLRSRVRAERVSREVFQHWWEHSSLEETKRAAARTAVKIHRDKIDNKCQMGRDILAYHASYYLTSI